MRDAGALVVPALARTLGAIDPPAEDDALVALARSLAAAADAIPDAQRAALLPPLSGQLVKVLAVLHERHRARLKPAARGPSALDQLRAARARSYGGA